MNYSRGLSVRSDRVSKSTRSLDYNLCDVARSVKAFQFFCESYGARKACQYILLIYEILGYFLVIGIGLNVVADHMGYGLS